MWFVLTWRSSSLLLSLWSCCAKCFVSDHSLRNGLLIFFLLVLPLLVALILVLLYVFRRDALDPCLSVGRRLK